MKTCEDHSLLGRHDVWSIKKDQKNNPLAQRKTKLFLENQWVLSYSIIINFLLHFSSETSDPDVSVSLSFQTYPWKWHTSCDWTQKAALELYFEGETTEPQLMPCSPLVWTTVNRFSLSKILEYDRLTKFSLSRSFGTTDKWDEIKVTHAETNMSSTVCLTTS